MWGIEMKKISQVAVFSLIAIFLLSGNAWALLITLDDGGGYSKAIVDGGMLDVNDVDGAVTFSGAIGPNWIMNVTTGTSNPVIGSTIIPMLDLNSVDASSTGGGTLTITVTDSYADTTSLISAITGFGFSVGGTTAGTVDFSADINGTSLDLPWSDLMKVGTAFAGFDSIIGIPGSGTFDLSIIAEIKHNSNGLTSFDAEVTPVPEPITLLLFGCGLFGMSVVGRKKIFKQTY